MASGRIQAAGGMKMRQEGGVILGRTGCMIPCNSNNSFMQPVAGNLTPGIQGGINGVRDSGLGARESVNRRCSIVDRK